MSFKSRKFSLMELSKGKAVVFMWSGRCVVGPCLSLWVCVCVCVARPENGVYGPTEAWHFKNAPCKSLFLSSVCRSSSLSFSTLKCHILSSFPPLSSHPLFLHPSAPENVNLHGFKYAHSARGVNHHFVFITCSLSSLSRCARGMTNWGVRKCSCCFWLQSSFFQWALPRGCGSSALVFRPNENSDWLEGCSPHASQLVRLN